MKRWMRLVPPTILVLLAACASNRSAAAYTDLNELSGEQIVRFQNAWLAVQTLRAQWLKGKAPGDLRNAAGGTGVFRDGMEVGGVGELQYMSTEGIAYIRYYDGIEASARWGLGHANGVIYVASRAGLAPGGGIRQ